MLSLVKKPILDNCNLKGIPKVLVLQHCRGVAEIDRADAVFPTDGMTSEGRHRMVNFISLKVDDISIDMDYNVFIIIFIFEG